MKPFYLFLLLLGICSCTAEKPAQQGLTLLIDAMPAQTPSGDTLFLASSLSNWQPNDPSFAFQRLSDGRQVLQLPQPPELFEGKITRGSWDTRELQADGNDIDNRQFSNTADTLFLQLAQWADQFDGEQASTATASVHVVSDSFYIPQLERHRRIQIYLPPSYDNSQQHYPVFYMLDGQNLFDRRGSYAGEWEVDEQLDSLFAAQQQGFIVVGIDHGGDLRGQEYLPVFHPEHADGEQGKKFMTFIAETLKPYIDQHYRTLPEAEHTGIMGSSFGGVAAWYGLITYPEVFGRAGIFSPSFWVSEELFEMAERAPSSLQNSRIYMMAGIQESPQMIRDMQAMQLAFAKAGLTEKQLTTVIHQDGTHSEWFWRREFIPAIRVLAR